MNMHETTTFKTAAKTNARRVTCVRADVRMDRSRGSSARPTWASSSSRLCFWITLRWTQSARRRSVFIRTPASRRSRSFSRGRSRMKRPPERKASSSREALNGCAPRAASGIPEVSSEQRAPRAISYGSRFRPEMESIESAAQYLGGEHFQSQGPARVILGRYGTAVSKVAAPTTINYLDVALTQGQKWRYEPPANHTVAWIAVHRGKIATPEVVDQGELAVFEESNRSLEFEALEATGFILGSAVKHPHDLVLGMYSVHTNAHALARGEARIAEIGKRLQAEGRR